MKKNAINLTLLSLMLMLVTSCSKAPQKELDDAKTSLEAAKSVEANRYLDFEFIALQDSLNVQIAAIEAEETKSFSSRNYATIKENLVKITAEADALKLRTEEYKVQVRDEVQQSLVALSTIIADDKDLLSKVPTKGKDGKSLQEAIQNDITIIEASVNEINTLISSGDYLTAKEKVSASSAKALAIKQDLTNMVSKTKKG
jgi:hypothetical protein